jgi:hypothetical protein
LSPQVASTQSTAQHIFPLAVPSLMQKLPEVQLAVEEQGWPFGSLLHLLPMHEYPSPVSQSAFVPQVPPQTPAPEHRYPLHDTGLGCVHVPALLHVDAPILER